jgi:hypothetical protein
MVIAADETLITGMNVGIAVRPIALLLSLLYT